MVKKKVVDVPALTRSGWIDLADRSYSIRRQCRLAELSRSKIYYDPVPESKDNLALMRIIDERYLKHPEYGYPRMTDWLNEQGYDVNHKRVARLMSVMGLQAITPGPHTSKPSQEHRKFPYLLRNKAITHPNHVWSIDLTYIPMDSSFMYLTAIIDWYSRYIVSWELSNTMDADAGISALEGAISAYGQPEIFNSDQGSQYTCNEFLKVLESREISISMDGKGRALDNVFIERFWWTIKYENIYPRNYVDGHALYHGLDEYVDYYNEERNHRSLDKFKPAVVSDN